jgi:hypothetical protein
VTHQKFIDADRDELYELYKLITFRKIPAEDIDYILEWVMIPNKWSAGVQDMIVWLDKFPDRDSYPLQDILDVEAFYEHIRRP